ncbi:glycosyltransferase [Clostridium sp. YIM B02555]|uniref:glycosyltransferase n=1 Tax=Clostridium sp. YIM B02555 TaxID=2911968 RepID=UPI001EEEDFCB|nr:glycosyltransferase [Clostridium sp. YIM B02555]
MKSILYISLADWYWIKQRPQHLCEAMSKLNYEVDYFCKQAWSRVGRCQQQSYGAANVNVLRQTRFPFESKSRMIEKINNIIIKRRIKSILKKKYSFVIVTYPNQIKCLTENIIKENRIIYDCMDNYKELFKNNKYSEDLGVMEEKVLSIAEKVVVSSEQIKKNLIYEYKAEAKKIKVINNGVDINNFNLFVNRTNIVFNNNKQKVGYIGTVGNWVDIELIKFAGSNRPEVNFYIIGPILKECPIYEETRKFKNIHLTGTKDYREIPAILKELDVAIIPFKLNKLIECVNPVKVYEYLAMNKPVVAVKYKETEHFKDLIYLYSSKEEFLEKLNKALSEKTIDTSRREYALKNSWEIRGKEFIEFINE